MTESLKLTIDDKEIEFGVIGFRVYVEATKRIRSYKEQAFSRVVGNIARDPLMAATTAASAIDAYMAGMIVSDSEIKQWMFSPEGEFFLVGYSLQKADSNVGEEEVERVFDSMSAANRKDLNQFFVKCLLKEDYEEPEKPEGE